MKYRFFFWNHTFDLELEEGEGGGPSQHFTYITLLEVLAKAKAQTGKGNYQWKMNPPFQINPQLTSTPVSGACRFTRAVLQNPELDGSPALWAFSPCWHLKTRPWLSRQNVVALGRVHMISLNCDYGILSQAYGLSGSVQRSHFQVYFLSHQILHSYLGC